jgi:sugar (pentulose or hexulose) kinase
MEKRLIYIVKKQWFLLLLVGIFIVNFADLSGTILFSPAAENFPVMIT